MGKDKLDKVVKDKLFDLHTPIDTSDLWQGIQTKMESEDSKPVAGFPFGKYLGFGVLAILLVGSLYLTQDHFSATSQSTDKNNIGEVNTSQQDVDASANGATVLGDESNNSALLHSSTNTTSNQSINESIAGNNSEGLNTNNQTEKSRSSNRVSDMQASGIAGSSNTGSSNTDSSSTSSSNTGSSSTVSGNAAGSSKRKTNTYDSKSRENSTRENNKTNGESTSDFTAASSIDERSNKSQNAAASTLNYNGTGGTTSNNIYESGQNNNNNYTLPISTDKSSEIENNRTLDRQKSRSTINALIVLESKAGLDKINNALNVCDRIIGDACNKHILNLRNRVDCYDNWNGDRSKISLLPYVGIDFVTHDQSRTDSSTEGYLGVRDNTMQFLEVIKAGLLIKYNVSQNLYVKAGIEYDQISEKFESKVVSTDQILDPNTTIAYRINMEGDTIPITGPGFTTVISTTEWRKYNKYHSFNVPIIVGYEAPISKRWDYFGEAGIFYNVKFNYEGKLLDQDNQVVSGENFYLNRTGVSIYGGAGARFNIDKRWSVFAVGSYKYTLASINNADINPIKQNLGLAGIAIGAEIRL